MGIIAGRCGCFAAFSRCHPQKQKQLWQTRSSDTDEAVPTGYAGPRVASLKDKLIGALDGDIIREAAELRSLLRQDAIQYFSSSSTSDPLTEAETKWMTDEVLGIHVRARETRAERLEIMVAALRWRIAQRETLRSCCCQYCAADPMAHDARLFGFDCVGDFVIMTCFELPQDISCDSIVLHMTCLLERALNEFPILAYAPLDNDGHPRARQWSLIFDLHGFGWRWYNPSVAMRLLEIFQGMYRGRLKKIYLIDAPLLFWGFFQVIRPFMNPLTTQKLDLNDWDSITPDFRDRLGTSLTAELLAEAKENRDPDKVASKVWTTFYGPSLHDAMLGTQILQAIQQG